MVVREERACAVGGGGAGGRGGGSLAGSVEEGEVGRGVEGARGGCGI